MARRKYNPVYHCSVVSNYRRLFKERTGQELKNVTDEQLWDIQESMCAPTPEEQDEWVLEELKQK